MRLFIATTIFLIANCVYADSWTKLIPGSISNLHGIVSVDYVNAYAVGDGGTILQTTDGGATWSAKHSGSLQLNGVGVDSLHTVIVGNQDEVLYTKNAKWNNLPSVITNNMNGMSEPISFDSNATRAGHGSVPSTSYDLNSLIYYFVGDHGNIEWLNFKNEIFGTEDNSGYWSYADSNSFTYGLTQTTWSDKNMHSVVTNGYSVYVVGDSGIFLRSNNRGSSYTEFNISPNVNFNSIAVINASHLLAIGDSGNIWSSIDNGATWDNVSPAGLAEKLNAVAFVYAIGTGIVAGDNGLILKTTDAGMTWVQQACNTLADLRAVSLFNGDNGIGASWMIAGDSGTILQCFFGGSAIDANYSVDTNSRSFGAVPINTKATTSFIIQNNSTLTFLTARAVSLSPLFTVLNDIDLDPTLSGGIKITFTPADTSTVNGRILLYTDEKWIPDTLSVRNLPTILEPVCDLV